MSYCQVRAEYSQSMPSATVSTCHRAIEKAGLEKDTSVELMTWLDV